MSIRPRSGAEVPELTVRMARASNPAGTTAMWVRDRLDGLWDDEGDAGLPPSAARIERLSQLPPGEDTAPRPPTAFQDYLDQHDIKRLRSWRAVG